MMFGFLKKKKPGCQVNHYKKAGHDVDAKMFSVIRLDGQRSKSGRLAYSIWQCSECGVRAFMAPYCFIYPRKVTRAVDEFIRREISMEELKFRLNEGKMVYETNTGETNSTPENNK